MPDTHLRPAASDAAAIARPRRRTCLAAAAAFTLDGLRAQPAPRELRVAAPGPRSTVSLPVEVAAGAGLDLPAGVRLRVLPVSGGAVALQQLVERNAEFAIAGLPAGMLMRAHGAPIVAVAALEQRPHYVLVVRRDLAAKVRDVASLRGRAIGVHSSSLTAKTTSHLLAELVLRHAGVPPDQVRFVSVGQNWETQASAMRAGTVDAIMGDEAFSQRLIDELGAVPVIDLSTPAQAASVPGAGFLRGTLFTREELVRDGADRVEAMVRVVAATLAWIRRHSPEQVADAMGATPGAERDQIVHLLRTKPDFYRPDPRFSAAQLRDTQVFFRASSPDDAAAQALPVEQMVVDRWAGRRE